MYNEKVFAISLRVRQSYDVTVDVDEFASAELINIQKSYLPQLKRYGKRVLYILEVIQYHTTLKLLHQTVYYVRYTRKTKLLTAPPLAFPFFGIFRYTVIEANAS